MSERTRRLLEGFFSLDLEEQNRSFLESLVLLEMRAFGTVLPSREIEQYRLLAPEAAESPSLAEVEERDLLHGLVDLFLATRRSGLLFLIGRARISAAAPAYARVLKDAGESLSDVEARDILLGLDKGAGIDRVVAESLRSPGMREFLGRFSESSDPELAGFSRRLQGQLFR